MRILYITGNGFDLWHKFPTSYKDFHKYASDYLNGFSQYFSSNPDSSPLWSNFEEDLGRFDWQSLYDEHNEIDVADDNFRPSMVYGLEDALAEATEQITGGLQSLFQEWIESIPTEGSKNRFYFEGGNKILSFNYTSTLHDIYKFQSDNVFHIHGKIGGELIIGHGEAINEQDELDENGESNRHMFTDAEHVAKSPLHRFKKPVQEIMENNENYFKSLNDIEAVVILGHSLNDIDMPYFEKIFQSTESANWVVSYYEAEEKDAHLSKLLKIGVAIERMYFLTIDEIPQHIKILRQKTTI